MSDNEWKSRLRRMGVPAMYYSARLSDFSTAIQKSLGDPYTARGYFLTGATGTGKTHLAAAILCGWTRAKNSSKAIFTGATEYLASIKASFDSNEPPSEAWIVRTHQRARFLVLDDLGAEKQTEWAFSALYRLIDYRVAELLPLIVTSNKSLQELDRVDPRIASRLGGLTVICLGGKDRRLSR